MHQMQEGAAPASGRLLRILLIWLGKVPADAAGGWVLRTQMISAAVCDVRKEKETLEIHGIESAVEAQSGLLEGKYIRGAIMD